MKKTLLFLIAATAMMMAGCSNDDFGGATQGMTLNATVEQPASRATMTESNDGTYKFSFTDNDKLNVTNSLVESYYTFSKQGDLFTSTDAQRTTEAADWYAYFPGSTVDLTGQTGDLAGVAKYYACAGKTESPTTGADGLNIRLTPQVAILRIKVDGIACNIKVKTADGKCVSGLKAKNNEAKFAVVISDTEESLLTKQDPGTYYIAVPAGVKIAIYNGGTLVRTTKDKGLTAGKYYNLTIGPVSGTAEATINGTTKKVGWVQLWPGGPKFATQNVANKMTFADATKTGADYVWGKNWRTPTKEEMTLVNAVYDPSSHNWVITPLHAKCEIAEVAGVAGVRYTGIMPGYTNQSIFLPCCDLYDEGVYYGFYWTSTIENQGFGTSLDIWCQISKNAFLGYYFNPKAYTTETSPLYVRPVLNEK